MKKQEITIKEIESLIAKREGKSSQTHIGNIKEIVGIVSDLCVEYPEVVVTLVENGGNETYAKRENAMNLKEYTEDYIKLEKFALFPVFIRSYKQVGMFKISKWVWFRSYVRVLKWSPRLGRYKTIDTYLR